MVLFLFARFILGLSVDELVEVVFLRMHFGFKIEADAIDTGLAHRERKQNQSPTATPEPHILQDHLRAEKGAMVAAQETPASHSLPTGAPGSIRRRGVSPI